VKLPRRPGSQIIHIFACPPAPKSSGKIIMRKTNTEIELLFKSILDICFKVHTQYGPGMLEGFYESVLCHELSKAGIPHERQVPVKVMHDGIPMGIGYKIDILVADEIIIELKSIRMLTEADHKQIITQLKTADKRLGLLVNFGEAHLKDGIHRKVNKL
jgi:GxxExxY protein